MEGEDPNLQGRLEVLLASNPRTFFFFFFFLIHTVLFKSGM